MKLGIIGFGFVGKAIYNAFYRSHEILVNNIKPQDKVEISSIEDLARKCEIIFISVPTPLNEKTLMLDCSIVKSCVDEIAKYSWGSIIVIKSTVNIGFCQSLREKYSDILIIYNPEFLSEQSAYTDFINPDKILFGVYNESEFRLAEKLQKLYWEINPRIPIITTNYNTAELVKLAINSYYAIKVSWANELYDLCYNLSNKKLLVDYEILKFAFELDRFIGDNHHEIWHKEYRGFNGSCLPKDSMTLYSQSVLNDSELKILKEAIKKNEKLLGEKYWLTSQQKQMKSQSKKP